MSERATERPVMRNAGSNGRQTREPRVRRELPAFLRVLRRNMPALVRRHQLKSLGVFGSFVRGTAKRGSDLDILVEFGERHSLYDFVRLQNDLSALLNVRVDLVERRGLKPHIGKRILDQIIWLRLDGVGIRRNPRRRDRGKSSLKPKRESLDYLNDIVPAVSQVEQFVAGMTFDSFVLNQEKIMAVTKAVENMGEAAKHIPADVRRRYPQVSWKEMAGMRDHLAHGYFAVYLPTLWETATEYIPRQAPLVTAALEQELKRRGIE